MTGAAAIASRPMSLYTISPFLTPCLTATGRDGLSRPHTHTSCPILSHFDHLFPLVLPLHRLLDHFGVELAPLLHASMHARNGFDGIAIPLMMDDTGVRCHLEL